MCVLLAFASCKKNEPIDEAKAEGKTTADFPQITADIFKPMDGGIDLSPEEIMGRNTWNLWSGGNQHFWNHAAQDSFGLMDLLKMLDNRKFQRGERFKVLGLVNEPIKVGSSGSGLPRYRSFRLADAGIGSSLGASRPTRGEFSCSRKNLRL